MINGIVPVLISPLTVNRQIDELGVSKLIEYFGAKECEALWVLGTGGEDMHLSIAEREKMGALCLELGAQLRPIIGVGSYCLNDSVKLAKSFIEKGATDLHFLPYNTTVSERQVVANYQFVTDAIGDQIWGYSSANWIRGFSPRLVEQLLKADVLKGIKFSDANIANVADVVATCDGSIQVITAVAKTLLPSLSLGVKACTSVEAMVFFDQLQAIYNHFRAGDLTDAANAQHQYNAWSRKIGTSAVRQNFQKISEIKYILMKRSLCEAYTSYGFAELSADDRDYLDSQMLEIPFT